MTTHDNITFAPEASADSRRRYQREVLAFEQRAEDALCLWAGTMAKHRAASAPGTPEGRSARRLWLHLACQYLRTINPPAAEYPEDEAGIWPDGVALSAMDGAEISAAGDASEAAEDKSIAADWRELSKDRRIVLAFALLLALGAAIGWALVQHFAR
jgi:hypothetical protein